MFRRLVPLLVIMASVATEAHAQTLDQKAWNAVWDRFEGVLGRQNVAVGPGELVHVMSYPIPMVWANRDEESLRALMNLAGIVPGEVFSIDPAITSQPLHERYRAIVSDIDLPAVDPVTARRFRAANDEWDAAYQEYMDVNEKYLALWENHKADLEDRGRRVDDLARLRFRDKYAGMFIRVQNKLDTAARKIQEFAPLARPWADALRRLEEQVAGVKGDLEIWTYEGDFARWLV